MPASAQGKSFYQQITAYFRKINLELLLFLVLVLNVKMVVKLAALIVLILLNRKMFRDKAIYRQRFIWFYAANDCTGIYQPGTVRFLRTC